MKNRIRQMALVISLLGIVGLGSSVASAQTIDRTLTPSGIVFWPGAVGAAAAVVVAATEVAHRVTERWIPPLVLPVGYDTVSLGVYDL